MLEKLRPSYSDTDHLFIGNDRYMYFTVSWDEKTHQLKTEKSFVDQADRTFRDSQNQDRCQIDPSKSLMALMLFDGIVTVMPISQKVGKKRLPELQGIGDPVLARIPDLFIRSFTFLHSRPGARQHFRFASLYENNQQKVCLSLRTLEYNVGMSGESDSAEVGDPPLQHWDDLELGASHIIAVPSPACKWKVRQSSGVPAEIFMNPISWPSDFV